ncbi:MAG TPA: hypothetical protein VN706_10740 [Gemmatimonadaceae bacterium]|nr:hypothetical protein [Gemmatimonadaceae bacterium]
MVTAKQVRALATFVVIAGGLLLSAPVKATAMVPTCNADQRDMCMNVCQDYGYGLGACGIDGNGHYECYCMGQT